MSKNKRYHPHAWAPYNFVPMPDKALRATLDQMDDTEDQNALPHRHDRYSADRHTGYFEVTLTTETPLFVRGMLTEKQVREAEDDKARSELTRKNPHAFSLDGKLPVLPGSSLRGMIRTLVEIATSSKMHFVSDNKLVYRAIYYADALVNTYRSITTDVIGDKEYMYPSCRMQGGYLEEGDSESGWVIRPATAYHGESFALVDRKDVIQAGISEKKPLVTFKVGVKPPTQRTIHTGKQGVRLHIVLAGGIRQTIGSGYEPATLIISSTVGKVGGKDSNRTWYPAIYDSDPSAEPLPISQRMWDDFVKDRDLNRGIDNRYITSGDALFYLLDNQGELLFFGPTMFFRVPYANRVGDLMPNTLQHRRNPAMDYTEALFGYVSEQSETRGPVAYAGRVSVTSAKVTADSPHREHPYDETIVPKILSSPKPTTFQHYLEQPDNTKGRDGDVGRLLHYGSDEALLRGHKLYWRQMIGTLRDIAEPDKSKNPDTTTQHTVIQPVRTGVEFAFKLHFENLTDAELGALAWVLTLGDDENARHQLGMGKPFGLGVVKLDPVLVLTPRADRYSTLFNADGSWFTAEEQATQDQLAHFVSAFKGQIPGFDDQQRIKELMALVQKQEAYAAFRYMQITPQNDYAGRPVLPYPTEVLAGIEADKHRFIEQETERQKHQRYQQIQEFKARIQQEGLAVGDHIEGKVEDYIGEAAVWFVPARVYYEDNRYNLTSLSKLEYEAELHGVGQIETGGTIQARIIEIDNSSDPIILTCEPLD